MTRDGLLQFINEMLCIFGAVPTSPLDSIQVSAQRVIERLMVKQTHRKNGGASLLLFSHTPRSLNLRLNHFAVNRACGEKDNHEIGLPDLGFDALSPISANRH